MAFDTHIIEEMRRRYSPEGFIKRLDATIADYDRYIEREGKRAPDLRPREVQERLDWYIESRAILEKARQEAMQQISVTAKKNQKDAAAKKKAESPVAEQPETPSETDLSQPLTLPEIAEQQPDQVGLALQELSDMFSDVAEVFKGLAQDTGNMKDNLDLAEPPKTASLRERVHYRRNYGATLRRLATEEPEALGAALSAIYTQLDEAADGLEAMADKFGLPLEIEESTVDQAPELEAPAAEVAPVVASQKRAQDQINGSFSTIDDLLKAINQARRQNPQKWIFVNADVAGKNVQIKTFGHTYLQIYRIDGQNQELPPMDSKVGVWTQAIRAPFQQAQPAPVQASQNKSATTTVDASTRTIHWHNYDIRYTADDFVNPDSFEEKWSNRDQPKAFVIHNQGTVLAIVFSEYYDYSEQDALDEAVDSNKLDGLLLDEKELEDYKVGEDSDGNPEYENVIFLGNASEPFSSESLDMFVIPAALFKDDPVIVAAKQDDEEPEFDEPEDEGHTASSKKATNGKEPKTAAGQPDSAYCSQCGPLHEDPDKPGYCERHGKKIRKPESKNAAGGMDDFTTAYFEAALWSSTDQSDESGGEPLDSNYSFTDIAPETREKMMADCAAFQDKYGDLITDENLVHGTRGEWGVYGMAGHDFWLTRNGHGAGFWDGDWEKPAADQLTKGSKEFGQYDLYIGDDGQIWGQ